jgi:RNA polymerase-binding protein DksA
MATKRKSAAQKALKEAAELAPLVQADQNGTDAKTSEKAAQKAAEYLLKTMGSQTGEKIVVDGITIPTQAELLNMPESDYMNEAQQAFFKHLLKEREAQLRSNAGETAEHLRENSIVPDPADRATIEEEHALELRTRDRERKLLKKVQEALRRLENGEYGWGEETGDPIGIPRLLARPTATLSLEAQQRRELRQKLYGN